ncbi:MAG TPA: TlpA disulfide reductase family protein [Ferrovaceae bacterium]|jgi:thiol-disulfide isomerase/thioredoxin|nr:TlpA disulfide reductase family protein [Ferrovaceae bacterium]
MNDCLAVEVGEMAPSFSAQLFSDKTVTNSTYAKQVVLINFWASWCDPCRHELPILRAFERKHFQDGFRVLLVSMDDESDLKTAKEIIKNDDFDSTWIQQADFTHFDRIWRIPLSYLIDGNGKIVKAEWYEDNDGFTEQTLETVITPLLNH